MKHLRGIERLIKQLIERKELVGFAPSINLPLSVLDTRPIKPKKPKKVKDRTRKDDDQKRNNKASGKNKVTKKKMTKNRRSIRKTVKI